MSQRSQLQLHDRLRREPRAAINGAQLQYQYYPSYLESRSPILSHTSDSNERRSAQQTGSELMSSPSKTIYVTTSWKRKSSLHTVSSFEIGKSWDVFLSDKSASTSYFSSTTPTPLPIHQHPPRQERLSTS